MKYEGAYTGSASKGKGRNTDRRSTNEADIRVPVIFLLTFFERSEGDRGAWRTEGHGVGTGLLARSGDAEGV
jgi:hypothetical protein